MQAKSYMRKYGKINSVLAIPVDAEMKRIADEAKRRKFDFNAWVRDVIHSRMQEVVTECEIDGEDKSA